MPLPPTLVLTSGERQAVFSTHPRTGQLCRRIVKSGARFAQALCDQAEPQVPIAVMKRPRSGLASECVPVLQPRSLRAAVESVSDGMTAVQKFVPSRRAQVSVQRMFWRRHQAPQCWVCSNRRKSDVNLPETLTTPPLLDGCTFVARNPKACLEIQEAVEGFVKWLEVCGSRTVVDEMVVDFMEDQTGKQWIVQVKAFKVAR
eukprot:TRINITY_DN23861_c0_g1_i1.p1 TRINITY_DN23861_c0_g1~~TRINITY_DN23861_c0_g1_i1.p1  ORF type:complete len:202 (-),score=27.30 TRINITY_DN23861_c0_g1_i1:61-666(-)